MLPSNEALLTASKWLNHGIAVIPIAYKSKRPIVSWRRYQDTLPTLAELQGWFRPGRQLNVAVICGWQGLTILDFDDHESYLRWLAWAVVVGGPARFVAMTTFRVRTGRGMHVYILVDETSHCGKWTWGDLKAIGGYVLIPPSTHPSGALYTVINSSAPIIKVGELAKMMPDPPEPPAPAPIPTVHVYPGSSLWPRSLAEEIRERIPVLELLPDAQPSGGNGRWYLTRCPFHSDQSPSLRIDTTAGIVSCFASCLDRPLDVIGLYARLNGISNGEAIRVLAERL